MLALSTSWNVTVYRSLSKILQEIHRLGFLRVELGFSHSRQQLSQFKLPRNQSICSIHNYCPFPEVLSRQQAMPDCFNLASIVTAERKKAIFYTKRTIRFAEKIKARAVIIHAGRVEIPDRTRTLMSLAQRGQKKEFQTLRERIVEERKENQPRHFECICESLKELTDFASVYGIRLGLENRIYIREIPNFAEIQTLLQLFSKKMLFYWHDTGHAFILQKLGFEPHLNYLKKYGKHLAGIHLHDVKGFHDHNAPFTGEINFASFKPYIKPETIQVIEAHQPATVQQIINAKEKLERLFLF